ncbi:MAG: glycosyltransferase family 4 protein [Acidobacteria bacterium]|nr:glycosyltransferase family 4 protein [Acidobacteriota bacterium]MDW7983278.1 glycosyltransferase family 1 protein [Acidobacteriota bacterium]
MKVVIDYRPALRNPTGVGLYTRWLIQHMVETHPDVQWYVFSSSWSDRLGLSPWADVPHVRTVDRRWPVRILNYVWPRWGWPHIESLIGASVDIAHSPYPLALPTRTARTIITVHDLWFLRPDAGTEAEIARDYPRFFPTACRWACRILTVSETTARQLEDLYPAVRDRIRVTPLGVPPEFLVPPSPDSAAEVRRAYGLPEGYVLFVGALNRRKNPGLAFEAVRILQSKGWVGPWVVVGQGPLEADLRERQHRSGVVVHFIGYVPRQQLPAIYGGAALLLMTSHDEGFGIPLLEAMASGVPVVALRRGAVPEVVGDAAVLVDEADAEAIAAACERVLADSALRTDLIQRGRVRAQHFRWSETARRTYEVYREVVEAGPCAAGIRGYPPTYSRNA